MADLTRVASLWRAGKRLDAEREVSQVLDGSPEDAMALRWLAEIYAASGRDVEAAGVWRRLDTVQPLDAPALRQFAQVLLSSGALGEAVTVLQAAIRLEPNNARAHNNLGLARLRAGDYLDAVQSLERALTIDPAYALAHLNLGQAQQLLHRQDAARLSYERALELEPHLADARVRLSALLVTTDNEAALRERDRALQSYAINLMSARRYDEAIPLWTQLLDSGAALPYLSGMRFHCRLHCCDWTEYEKTAAQLHRETVDGRAADLPFNFFVHSNSPAAQLRCSRTYVATICPAVTATPPDCPPGERIRIAYLSFDFFEHATAYLLAGVFEAHDRARFEVTALSYGPHDRSAMRTRLESSVERFIDVCGRSDSEIADLMRGLGIQIAVDLKGFTGAARTGIFAHRAAPIQVNFLGYPGTMGADFMDYIIADRRLIGPGEEIHYSEKVVLMPHSYQPNDPQRPLPAAGPSRESLGLPPSGFVFCSFNNLYKITPQTFGLWMELLREVPGSVLWLLSGPTVAQVNLRAAAACQGIGPERLVFAPHLSLEEHLARYLQADLFLDTLPCNAHTTASDALWMGVPVVTLTGRTFAGRVATSLLHAVGLTQLCTASPEQYRALALNIARSPDELSALKVHLERGRRMFALFDAVSYTKCLEDAYAKMWERHLENEPPVPWAVADSGGRG